MNTPAVNRRTFAYITTGSVASLALPVLWAQSRPTKTKVAIAVTNKAALYYLPLTITEQLGYFRAEGLEVEIIDLAHSVLTSPELASGTIDVVSGDYAQTIELQSRGQNFQAFVLQGRAPAVAMGILPKAIPGYRSLADLRGKRIGVSAAGSASHRLVNLTLARVGLTPGDVSFIDVGSAGAAWNAVRAGQIDALSNVDPVMTLLEQKGDIRIIADARTLKGSLDIFGGPMPAGCLYASIDFIQKNRNTVQALTSAMAHGLKWLQTAGPSDIIKTVPEAYMLGDRAVYLGAFNRVRETISPDGLMPEEGPRNAVRVLASVDQTIRAANIDLAKTYTNQFASKARERFSA